VSTRRVLSGFVLALALLFIAWIALSKIHDSDFWWHVTAGKIFRSSGWITVDPFAHTRIGESYLATQSWLSEYLFSVLWDLNGATGVILLRMILIVLTLGTLLLIDPRRFWPNAFFVMMAAIALRSSLLDRPQLFTYLCFSLAIFITFKILESPEESHKNRTQFLIGMFVFLAALQVLWSNLHGGASLVLFGLVGAVFLQYLFDALREQSISAVLRRKETIIFVCGIAVLCVGFLLTPSGFSNVTYTLDLFTDQTSQFIREWRTPGFTLYAKQLLFAWVLVLSSVQFTRYKPVASVALLVMFGLLSMTAVRHMALFLLLAIGLTILQLKHNEEWNRTIEKILSKPKVAIGSTFLGLFVIAFANEPARITFARNDFDTFGTHEPASTAYTFIEENNLAGNMFNTYGLGGYLIFRGYPNRKVFVDGRNVDYGFDFLKDTLDAAQDENIWRKLEDEYDLTYAVIEFIPTEEQWERYPYVWHLDKNLLWHLVFLDEEIAVYVKDTPEHSKVTADYEYKVLTPENFHRFTVFEEILPEQINTLEQELLRQVNEAPKSIQGLLLLAEIYKASGLTADAEHALREAMRRQPHRTEPKELLLRL
jgi:hypothetical protein